MADISKLLSAQKNKKNYKEEAKKYLEGQGVKTDSSSSAKQKTSEENKLKGNETSKPWNSSARYTITETAKTNSPVRVQNASTEQKEKKSSVGSWAGRNAMSGLAQFNKGLFATLDFILPTEFLGRYDFVSKLNDYYGGMNNYYGTKAHEASTSRGKGWKVAGDVLSGTVAAAPNAILAFMSGGTSLATNGVGTLATTASSTASVTSALGQTVKTMLKNPSYWTSVMRTLGTDFEEAKERGANDLVASCTAILTTALNAGIEVGGGIEKLPKNLKSGSKSLKNALFNWVKSTLEEGGEEVLQGITTNAMAKLMYDHETPLVSLSDDTAVLNPVKSAKEFGMGVAVGGLLGGGQASVAGTINTANVIKTGKYFNSPDIVQSLIDTGLESPKDTQSYKLAEKAQKRKGNLNNYDIGKLYFANVEQIELEEKATQKAQNESSQTDITNNVQIEKETNTNREATFWDLTINSLKRGYVQSLYGQESYKAMMGQKNNKAYYEERLKSEDYSFIPDAWYEKALSGAMEILGQQWKQWTDGRSLATGTAAAGAAALAGQAGPQIAVPEEIITVPSAFLAGIAAGSVTANFEIEAGLAYNEMVENGISPDLASKIALGVGAGNAALEMLQIDDLVKSFKILNASDVTRPVAKKILSYLTKKGVHVTAETAQEAGQEAVTLMGVDLGRGIEGKDAIYTWKDVGQRMGETVMSSAMSYGLLGTGGDVINYGINKTNDVIKNKHITHVDNSYNNSLSNNDYSSNMLSVNTNSVKTLLSDLNKARKYFVEYTKKHFPESVLNIDTQKRIGISRNGIDKFLSGNISKEKFSTGYKIPELISTAYKVGEAKNLKSKPGINGYEYYENNILIDGEEYKAHIRVRNTNMGDKYYGHTVNKFVDEIKIEPLAWNFDANATVHPINASGSNNIISQDNKTVNKNSVSIGDVFKDTKYGNTITVVERDDTNTAVEIDNGKTVERKVLENAKADTLILRDQYEQIGNSEKLSSKDAAVPAPNAATDFEKVVADYVETEITDVEYDLKKVDKTKNIFAGTRSGYVRVLSDGTYESGTYGEGSGGFVPNENIVRSNSLEEVLSAQYKYMLENSNGDISHTIQKHLNNYNKRHNEIAPVSAENTTVNEDVIDLAEGEIKPVVDAINETLLPGAKESIFASMEKVGQKGDIAIFAKRMVEFYAEKGTIGSLADYFSDSGEKVVAAIENMTKNIKGFDIKSDGISGYTEEEKKKISKVGKSYINYVVGKDISLEEFFNHSRKNSGKFEKLYLGKISGENIEKINKVLNDNDVDIDVTGEHYILTNDMFDHTEKGHGINSKDSAEKVTQDNIKYIIDVINSPDKISFGGFTREGNPIVVFEKLINDTNSVYVQFNSVNRNGLIGKTFYFQSKMHNKKGDATANNVNTDPVLYAQSDRSQSPITNNIISQDNDIVNSSIRNENKNDTESVNTKDIQLGNDGKNFLAKLQESANIFNNTPKIFSINTESIKKKGKMTESIEAYFKDIGGKVVNPVFGIVELNKKGAKTTVFHGMSGEKFTAVAAIKDVIEKGFIISHDTNWKNRGYDTYLIAGKGDINGDTSVVGVIVKNYPNSKHNNKFYLHEVIKIGASHTAVDNNSTHVNEQTPINNNIISQENNVVNNSVRTNTENDTKTAKVIKAIKNSLRPEIISNPKIMSMLQERFGENGFAEFASDIILTYSQNGSIGEHEALFTDGGKAVYDALEDETQVQQLTNEGVKFSIDSDFVGNYDNWVINGRKNGVRLKIGVTSEALQSIGVKEQSIIWDTSKINKTLKKHSNLNDKILKDVPRILENPIIVMQSLQTDSRLTMFGDVNDRDGKPVLVVIELDVTSGNNINLDEIKVVSTYGKDNAQSLINRSEILYVEPNKNRTNNWLVANRLQLPLHITDYGSIRSITYPKGNVNTYSMQSETKNSRNEEFKHETERSNILYGSSERSDNASAGKQTGNLRGNEFKTQDKTEAERKDTAKELREKGQTKQQVINIKSSGKIGKIQIELINQDAYNDDMRSMVDSYKKVGIELELFLDNGKVAFDSGRNFVVNGFKVGNSKMYLRYDGTHSPQTLGLHELIHINWNSQAVQKVKDQMLNKLTENEKNNILALERYQGYIEIYNGDIDMVWQEFIADTLSGMNEYQLIFSDIVAEYWKSSPEIIDIYKVSEYTEIIDTGDVYDVAYHLSDRKWYPDLSKKKLDELKRIIRRDVRTSPNSITDTANWLFTNIDGTEVFAIYSTEDVKDPTLLYESKGKKAEQERDILLSLLEVGTNGESFNGKSSFADRVSKGNWLQYEHSMANSNGSLVRGSSNRDASILQRKSPTKGSRAFKNVVENLFQIQGTDRSDTGDIERRYREKLNDDISYSLAGENTEFWDEWLDKIKEYGAISTGENPYRDIQVPQRIDEKRYVSRFARTMMETKITPDDSVSDFERAILDGEMIHEVITNKKAQTWARQQIEYLGFEEALKRWAVLSEMGKIGKNELALGMELYNQCITNKDVHNAMKIAAELAAEATRAGQTLQACRLLKLMTPDGQLYYLEKSIQKMNDEFREKIGTKFKDIELNEELMKEFLCEKDEAKRNVAYDRICQNIADQIPATKLDKWNSWRYLAMLGNPRTHIRNIVGNAVFIPSIRIKNYIGAVVEKMAKIKTDDRTKSIRKSKEAVEFAKEDFDAMVKVLQGENAKYAITSDIEGKRTIFKTKWLEKLRLKNFDFLEKEDMWFLKMHYVDALARLITIRNTDIGSITPKTLETLRAYAVKEAQAATYRDANSLAEGLNKLQRKLERSDNKAVRATSVLLEGVMPFKKTPMNIAKQGINYSPIGILKGTYKAFGKLKDGSATVDEVIDDFAKGLTGTGVMLLGLWLASLGILVGAGDKPKKEKEFDKMVGEQSYALKIKDAFSYTIDWMTPSNLSLFIGAKLYDLTKDDFSFADIVDALSTVTEPLLELSVFSGLNGVIESAQYSDSEALLAIGSDMITSYLLQALPTIGGQLSRIIDDSKREYYYIDKNSNIPKGLQSLIGQASSKIPFASYLFEPAIDEWGREEKYGNIVERAFENIASPGYYAEDNYTAVDKELKELYERTGESSVLPVVQQKYYVEDKIYYYMSAEEYTKVKKMRGQRSFKYVKELLDSSKYRAMSDEEKVKAVEKCYEQAGKETKEKMLKEIKK